MISGDWHVIYGVIIVYSDDLLVAPVDKGADMLPSPNQLKRKFILKVRPPQVSGSSISRTVQLIIEQSRGLSFCEKTWETYTEM